MRLFAPKWENSGQVIWSIVMSLGVPSTAVDVWTVGPSGPGAQDVGEDHGIQQGYAGTPKDITIDQMT